MSILINPWSKGSQWLAELQSHLPDEDFVLWSDDDDSIDRAAVEMVVAWRMKRADLQSFTNLHTILSMGAGTEQWQREGTPAVRIVRLADPAMSDEMAAYALHWVTHFQRDFDARFGPDDLGTWGTSSGTFPAPSEHRVGILGYGTIGRRIARAFAELGYPINAWSRSGTDDAGVSSFAGLDQLADFLASSDAIINVLPNTPATTGLLDAERFAQFAHGSVFINIGRGTVVADETELIAALDSGPLRAAVLDVTSPEPPRPDSPLLTHDKVWLTPHIAGSTQVPTAAALIAANIARIRAGEEPFPVVDPSTGY